MKDNNKPFGLDAVHSEIRRICEDAQMYKKCGMKPNHMIINLDNGDGRSTLVEYIMGCFKENGILDFRSGVDDYIEFELDGSLQQMRTVFAQIDAAAVYDNEFNDIIALGVSDIANHLNEVQFTEFISNCKKICDNAFVIFYIHSNPSNAEERLVEKLVSSISNIDRIVVSEYTADNLCDIAVKEIEEHGVDIDDYDSVYTVLQKMFDIYQVRKVKEAVSMAKKLIRFADFTHHSPVISGVTLKAVINESQLERSQA